MLKHLLLALCLVECVFSHGILTSPYPRLGIDRLGTSSKKYTHADYGTSGEYPLRSSILNSCGDETVGTTQGIPMVVYLPQTGIGVTWMLTLPHAPNGQAESILVQARESETASWVELYFEETLDGSEDVSGSIAATAGDTMTVGVTFPEGFECNECILEWVWDTEADGGGYIDCADIAVRDPLTLTLTITVEADILNENLVVNDLMNYFPSWTASNMDATVVQGSGDDWIITVSLTDFATVPAEVLVQDFYNVYEDETDLATLEATLGATVLSVNDNGGGGDTDGNPFLGSAAMAVPSLLVSLISILTFLVAF